MGVQYQHLKRYQNFFGIDLKSNDLEFPEQFASDCDNIEISRTGSIEKRVGYQPHAEPDCSNGLFVYNRVNENGEEVPEVIGVSDTLKKLAQSVITVTYTGSDPNARISFVFDTATDQYRCQIEIGTATVLDSALGLGRDDPTPKTVNQLKTEIDALADLTATISGDLNVPAAFCELSYQFDLTSGPYLAKALYWASLNVSPQTGKTGPLEGSETHKNDEDFENATSVVLQNCLYVANGYDEVIKYDGQNAYRAGVPTPGAVSATGGAGANVYIWRSQYVQTDAVSNTVEGNLTNSPRYTLADPGSSAATVTVRGIQAGTGFNTNCALITATATGTAIPVTAGHTMKAGDTAYLYDTVTAAYVTRSVVSVGATTVTVDSSVGYTSSTTNSRNVISNNLRIRIFRNQNTGITPTIWYEVVDLPNNSFAVTQTYTDNTSDTNLLGNIQLVEPITDRSPPIKGKYISAFQTLMVTAGDPENPNTVSVSDIENCEYFPFPDNQFTVNNLQGDIITGLHPSNENFLIFQSRAIHAMTGDVPNGNFRVDTITTDIGCAAHATIQDVRGTVCFLSPVGPRVMTGASIPQGLGASKDNGLNSRLDPLFTQRGVSEEQLFRLRRAIALNDRRGEKYILFVPAESETTGGDKYVNEYAETLVYDYTRDAWVKRSGLNMGAGIISTNDDNDIYFIERRELSGVVYNYAYRFLNTGTFLDYQDHNQAITCTYKSPWEFMGEAGLRKNFQAIRVYGIEQIDREYTVDINTESNFTPDNVISTCAITFGAGGYGTSEYGVDPFGDPSTTGLKHKLSNGRVTSLRVILSNDQEQTNISITGYELEIATPYNPKYLK